MARMGATAAAVAAAFVAVAAGPAWADGEACKGGALETKDIVVMADWLPWASQAGMWEAKRKGLYEKAGLNVDIKAPPNPADPIKLVAMKRVNFSMTYVPEVMMAREMLTPVTSVAVLMQQIDSGLAWLPDRHPDIKTAADLKGKTLGVGPKRDAQAFLSTMLDTVGLKRTDVKVVDPGFGHVKMVEAGQIDLAHALAFGEQRIMTLRQKAAGKPDANILKYSDYGVPAMHYMLLVSNVDWTEKNPNTTCAFLKTTIDGLNSALKDPADVTKFITDARPGVYTLEENTDRWEQTKHQWTDANGRMLRNDPEKWKAAQAWALKYKLITEPVEDYTAYFSNAYVPKQ